jgi:hypothetical protein
LALTLPFAEGCSPSPESIASQPFLFSHLADKNSIIEAGLAYRKQFPKENDMDVLSTLLIGRNASKDSSTIEKLLNERILGDFKTGKIITTVGWVLSLTEARQCALYSILNA